MKWLDRFRRKEVGEPEATVAGERGESVVQRPASLQSRLSNYLALGLMGALGLGLLGWYYAHSLDDRRSARVAAQSSAQEKAKGEVPIRPLGRIDPPAPEGWLGETPDEPPLPESPPAWPQATVEPASWAVPVAAARSPRDLQLERQLAGRAFSAGTLQGSAPLEGEGAEGGPASAGELDPLLRPSVSPAASAQRLPTQTLLLAKGTPLDCTLLTAIDSTLPGLVTCVTATDTFSADGKVVLMERGTRLVGETRGQVQRGSARIFVLWSEARTPHGVVITLASPGTDELGRSGLPGKVNRHFFERFGAAILVSVIDGAIQAVVENQRESGDTVMVESSGSQDIVTEVLRSTVNIPPTVVKPQGDRIQVMVARDLDFRRVYELRPAASGR